jgi:threonine aldolase
MVPVDLRSDTVTRPTAPMMAALMAADVGDDVFGDDPETNALQAEAAELLGFEAALFTPSGTMANEVAIRAHTEHGDEIIVERGAHIYQHEGAAPAALAGVTLCLLDGDGGLLSADQVEGAIRDAPMGGHHPYTTLICLENPANEAGGVVYPLDRIDALLAMAKRRGIPVHLDGARLFNGAAALGQPAARLARGFASVSICLSKSLGCPVGSLLLGSGAFIERAHRFRKMFGGGMRQTGFLAAAGRYALRHHIDRLAEDHHHARLLAEVVGAAGAEVDLPSVQTNMVYFRVPEAAAVVAALADQGVLCLNLDATRIRLVTHLDVTPAGVARTSEALREVLSAHLALHRP